MATARNLKLTPDPEPRVVELTDISIVPVKQDNHFDHLCNSIQQLGILQPPVLREPAKKDQTYEIIAGRRRIAAAEMIGIPKIICVVYPKNVDKAFIPSATIAENQVRSNNIGADIVAMGLLVDQGYDDPEVVSSMTGLPQSDVKKLFELRDLPKPVLDGIVSGNIATTTAHEVKKLRPKAMERALGVLDEKGKLTTNDIRRVREVQIEHAASQVTLPDIPDLPDAPDLDFDGTDPNEFAGVFSGSVHQTFGEIVQIVIGEGSGDEKIKRIRELLGIPDEPSDAAEPDRVEVLASETDETIAQRARKRSAALATKTGDRDV